MHLIANQPFTANGKSYSQGQSISDAGDVKFILENGSEHFVTKVADAPVADVDTVQSAQVAKKTAK